MEDTVLKMPAQRLRDVSIIDRRNPRQQPWKKDLAQNSTEPKAGR